jgi:hypothetical protein
MRAPGIDPQGRASGGIMMTSDTGNCAPASATTALCKRF